MTASVEARRHYQDIFAPTRVTPTPSMHAHEREVALALLPELLVQCFLFGVDARLLGALLGLARAEQAVEGDVAGGTRRRCPAVEVDRAAGFALAAAALEARGGCKAATELTASATLTTRMVDRALRDLRCARMCPICLCETTHAECRPVFC